MCTSSCCRSRGTARSGGKRWRTSATADASMENKRNRAEYLLSGPTSSQTNSLSLASCERRRRFWMWQCTFSSPAKPCSPVSEETTTSLDNAAVRVVLAGQADHACRPRDTRSQKHIRLGGIAMYDADALFPPLRCDDFSRRQVDDDPPHPPFRPDHGQGVGCANSCRR